MNVAVILLDCGLRPEECFRLRWGDIRDGGIEVPYGKTHNAARRVPLSPRAKAILNARRSAANSRWVFPAQTKSGHIEPGSVKRAHLKACEGDLAAANLRAEAEGKPKQYRIEPFPLYTLRHTCLTRWAPHVDPWTLAHLAGHRDMAITKRYVHPQDEQIQQAMERARSAQGGHNFGHSRKNNESEPASVFPLSA